MNGLRAYFCRVSQVASATSVAPGDSASDTPTTEQLAATLAAAMWADSDESKTEQHQEDPSKLQVTLTRGATGLGLSFLSVDQPPAAGVYISRTTGPPATASPLKSGHRILRMKGSDTDWFPLESTVTADVAAAFKHAGQVVTLEVCEDPFGFDLLKQRID